MTGRYAALVPTAAETRLITAAATGEDADLRPDKTVEPDPSEGPGWGEDRSVRADVIYALCLGLRPDWPVHAKGLWLRGARIEGRLDFEYASLTCPVRLHSCYLPEPINLEGATVPMLSLSGSLVTGIRGDGLTSRGAVCLDKGFTAVAQISLLDAEIGGQLICSGGRFSDPKAAAIEADGLVVKGDVLLDEGFTAVGESSLLGAEIGGQLICSRGRFTNTAAHALSADGMKVEGDVFLDDGFAAEGEIRLLGARVGGELSCRGGRFSNPGGLALDFERVTVGSHLLLDAAEVEDEGDPPCIVDGGIDLRGALVGGNLQIRGALLDGRIRGVGMQVAGAFRFRRVRGGPQFEVDLSHAAVGELDDDRDSWCAKRGLTLSGFSYRAMAARAPSEVSARLAWLRRQSGYTPSLYEQLAKVYREAGRTGDARRVLVARHIDRYRRGDIRPRQVGLNRFRRALNWVARCWSRFMRVTVGYGYRPWMALIPLAIIVVAGSILFQVAFDRGVVAPAPGAPEGAAECVSNYPCFHSIAYTLDVTVPIVEFGQQEYWAPSADIRGGSFYLWWMWFSTAAGWVLSATVVAGAATVIRRD